MPIGVKVNERDASLYSNSSSSNPCLAVIGTATKGPIGVPTLCISQKDLKAKFGPQNPNCLGIYAANFALAEINRCYYVRVAKDAVKASVSIPGSASGSTVDNLLTLEAASEGTFYNNIAVEIQDATEDSFTLVVKDSSNSNVALCTYKGLSLDPTSETYIGTVLVNDECVSLKEFKGTPGTKYILKSTETKDGKEVPIDYKLSGGDDGITGLTTNESPEGEPSGGNIGYHAALDLIQSDNYDVEIIVTPGVYDNPVIQKGLDVARLRGDAIYIADPPSGLTYEEAIKWHNGITEDKTYSPFNSSYGAAYWSWQYIYDEINSQEVLVPPSVVVPAVYARNDMMAQPWYAPAGLTRGLLKNVLRSESIPDSSVQDLLYSDPNNINPIITHPTSGLAVFGQKTLWRQSTSLNRVNVRRLVSYIKRVVKDIAQYLVFEPNDEDTWNSFYDLVDPRLNSIQLNRGLYEYKIVKGESIVTDEDIDNYRMPVQILIKPTKSAEFIPIDIVISATGTNFNEYESAYVDEV